MIIRPLSERRSASFKHQAAELNRVFRANSADPSERNLSNHRLQGFAKILMYVGDPETVHLAVTPSNRHAIASQDPPARSAGSHIYGSRGTKLGGGRFAYLRADAEGDSCRLPTRRSL